MYLLHSEIRCMHSFSFLQAFSSPSSLLDPNSAGGRLRKVVEEWCSYLLTTPRGTLGKTCCCLLQSREHPQLGEEHRHLVGPAHCTPELPHNSSPQGSRAYRCDCPCLIDTLLDKLLSLLIKFKPPGFFFGCQPLWPVPGVSTTETVETAAQVGGKSSVVR